MPGLKKLRTEPPIPRLNILIVKLSSLGDVVHTMPAVQGGTQASTNTTVHTPRSRRW